MTAGSTAGSGGATVDGSAAESGTGQGDGTGEASGAGPANAEGAVPGPLEGPGPLKDPGPRKDPGPLKDPGLLKDAGPVDGAGAGEWRGVGRGLLRMRRLLLLCGAVPSTVAVALVLGAAVGGAWAVLASVPLAGACWGWGALARNWRSWRYAERADDLLISRGVMWREVTVVPYGRMQLVEVTSGPLERRYGLARLQLHTAAATTDAAIPGLAPDEAERLRDRLTELGGARSAGL